LSGIAHELEKRGILSPAEKEKWQFSTVRSILSNEKYKGDAIKRAVACCPPPAVLFSILFKLYILKNSDGKKNKSNHCSCNN
jgi:hypothetical protein